MRAVINRRVGCAIRAGPYRHIVAQGDRRLVCSDREVAAVPIPTPTPPPPSGNPNSYCVRARAVPDAAVNATLHDFVSAVPTKLSVVGDVKTVTPAGRRSL